MALIPRFFLDTVTAIGVGKVAQDRHWIGTGFLYGRYASKVDENTNEYNVFLVTNKHVLEGLTSVFLKFNSAADLSSKDYELTLIAKNGKPIWIGHPNPEVDVAVIAVNANLLRKDARSIAWFHSDGHVMNTDELKAGQASEGDPIFVLGFPMGLVDQDRQYVICRSGVIARIRDLFEGRATDFLLDATVFPGNSGGPVITCPEGMALKGTTANTNSRLIGIIKSYVPYRETAISNQTRTARIIFEENSGLSAVEPADHIVATIDLAMRKQRNRAATNRYRAKKGIRTVAAITPNDE